MTKGKFVTFEGCEGVGKSWQINSLKNYLDKNSINFVVTREPGGSKVAENIRQVILSLDNLGMTDTCEAFLYSAARAQHINDIIKPALDLGKLVICDRYIDSTFAYQGIARGLGQDFIGQLNRLSAGSYIPDLTVFLDYPPELAFARKGGADKNDRLENMDINFHKKVYQGYKILLEMFPERFVSVDASGSKQQTHDKVVNLLKSKNII